MLMLLALRCYVAAIRHTCFRHTAVAFDFHYATTPLQAHYADVSLDFRDTICRLLPLFMLVTLLAAMLATPLRCCCRHYADAATPYADAAAFTC